MERVQTVGDLHKLGIGIALVHAHPDIGEDVLDLLKEMCIRDSTHDFLGVAFHVSGRDNMDVRVNMPGEFSVYNALAALTVEMCIRDRCRARARPQAPVSRRAPSLPSPADNGGRLS